MALLDLMRQTQLDPKKIHAISSISAMVQLVQGGFGVALLPRVAARRLANVVDLKLLTCDAKPQALPIHASYRTDPTSETVEQVVQSAFAFVSSASRNASEGKS